MASIGERPFLEHLLDRAISQGVTEVHLLVGYSAQAIVDHFGNSYCGVPLSYSYEDVPLGTGGALKAASSHLADTFILANGDTFSEVEYSDLLGLLDRNTLSLSLVKVADGARYGSAITDGRRVVGFREKGLSGPCLVNAGVYGCRRGLISEFPTQSSFSFEVDFLEPWLALLRPQFHLARSGMIDIGTPESFALANLIFGKGRS